MSDTFYVIFKIDQQTFAVRLDDVHRIVRVVHITPMPEAPKVIEGVINVQGDVIPVVNMRTRFRMDERDLTLDDQILLIRSNQHILGLLVDEVVDIIESDSDQIVSQQTILPGAERIRGVMKKDEDMILIQDIETLLSADEEKKLEISLKKKSRTGKSRGK